MHEADKDKFRRKFIALNAYIRKESKINDLKFNLKELESKRPNKPKEGKRKELAKIKKINEIENK